MSKEDFRTTPNEGIFGWFQYDLGERSADFWRAPFLWGDFWNLFRLMKIGNDDRNFLGSKPHFQSEPHFFGKKNLGRRSFLYFVIYFKVLYTSS
jgi:hypothetical protein